MENNRKKIYIYLKHFAVDLKLTQYCKSTIVQDKVKIIFNGEKEIFEMQITKG